MRIALADRPSQVVGFGWAAGQPAVQAREPTSTIVVREAAARVGGGRCEIVDAMLPVGNRPVDALIFRDSDFSAEVLLALWPGVPTAAFYSGSASTAVAGVEMLDLGGLNQEGATKRIEDWLQSSASITPSERQMLEVLVGTLRRALDDNRDLWHENYDLRCENAQLRSAVDTLDAQLHAPLPSRSVIKWALNQVDGFVVGILSSEALPHLQELLHHFL